MDSIKLSTGLGSHHVDVSVKEGEDGTDTLGHQAQLGQVSVDWGQDTCTGLVTIYIVLGLVTKSQKYINSRSYESFYI